MRVATKRWGEVTIKKQGEGKNKFDKTKSFSIDEASIAYSIEEYFDLLKIATELTASYTYDDLKTKLKKIHGVGRRKN